MSNGVRQGSVLSPFWFAVYLDDLLVELRESGVGCNIIGGHCLQVLLLMLMILFC